MPLDDGHARRIDARLRQRLERPFDAGPLHVMARAGQPFGVDRAIVAAPRQPHRQHADLAMPQLRHVPHRRLDRPAVVDAHEGHALHPGRLIADHRGQPALEHRPKERIVLRHRIHHEGIHHRLADEHARIRRQMIRDLPGLPGLPAFPVFPLLRALRGRRRDDQQRIAAAAAFLREAREEVHRRGIVEGEGQLLGEQHAHGTDAAHAQTARHRVRTGVTLGLRLRENALAKLRRQLVRPVVGVGHRGPRHPQLRRDRRQRPLRPAPVRSVRPGRPGRTGLDGIDGIFGAHGPESTRWRGWGERIPAAVGNGFQLGVRMGP